MKCRCFACGVEKDTSVPEFYTIDDHLTRDRPIDPLFVIDCEGWGTLKGQWKTVVICHRCFAILEPDMWISSACWAKLTPKLLFEQLPDAIPRDGSRDEIDIVEEAFLALHDEALARFV